MPYEIYASTSKRAMVGAPIIVRAGEVAYPRIHAHVLDGGTELDLSECLVRLIWRSRNGHGAVDCEVIDNMAVFDLPEGVRQKPEALYLSIEDGSSCVTTGDICVEVMSCC